VLMYYDRASGVIFEFLHHGITPILDFEWLNSNEIVWNDARHVRITMLNGDTRVVTQSCETKTYVDIEVLDSERLLVVTRSRDYFDVKKANVVQDIYYLNMVTGEEELVLER
jgi:hypothetical protein